MADSPRRILRTSPLRWLVLPAVLGTVAILPWAFMYGVFWAATRFWEFDGPGLRYWLFVRGTRLERLGTLSPAGARLHYVIQPQEGNFPGWSVVVYASNAAPEAVLDYYAGRCRDMGLKITSRESRKGPPASFVLVCEIEPDLDVEVVVARDGRQRPADVIVKVWGAE